MVTEKVSEYEKQAMDFLAEFNITFDAVLLGDDCPKFCEDAQQNKNMREVNVFPRRSHIHGKHYRCTFTRIDTRGQTARTVSYSLDFWNSYADEERNYFAANPIFPWQLPTLPTSLATIARKYPKGTKRVKPTAYDVLACLQKNDPGSFEDFCADYGYDTDSRRAEDTWRAVREEWEKVRRFFRSEEMEKLAEIS